MAKWQIKYKRKIDYALKKGLAMNANVRLTYRQKVVILYATYRQKVVILHVIYRQKVEYICLNERLSIS